MNVSMFVYVLLLERTYIHTFTYVMAYIFTYLHIFTHSVDWKEWDEGSKCEKGRVGEGGGNGLLQSEFLLSNFIAANG